MANINTQRLNEWQGSPILRFSNTVSFEWDKEDKRYYPVSFLIRKGELKPNTGIRFTRFHAVGGYPTESAKKRGVMDWFYSGDLFGRAIFRSNDTRKIEGIRPSDWGGEVPLQEFHEAINEITGARDWLKDYTEAEFVYEIGSSVHVMKPDGSQKLRVFVQSNTRESERTYSKKRAKVIDKKRKEYRKRKTPKDK